MMFKNEGEISSIIEASKCMASDKIMERRKNAETLSRLLENTTYTAILDRNTDELHGFTWNDIFAAAESYLMKEVEKYKQDEIKRVAVSQTQKTSRENQLQSSSNSLLNIIVLASEHKPRLDVDLVLHHCLIALKDPFLFEKFGRDHLTALNREILSRRGYWSKLKPNSWLSLFLISLKLLKNSLPVNVTYVSLASLLNYVMHHGTVQSDISLKIRKKLQFFMDNLNNKAMLQKEHNLVKIWMDSSIQLAFSVGSEDRYHLCLLTETTLNTFLDLCHDHIDDIETIVQYSILALIAHHPCGVESNETGFMVAVSTEEWMRTLRRLHSLVDFLIKTHTQRNKTAENKIHELDHSTIKLAVRVARQIFSSTDLSMEVTRMGVMDETSTTQISGPSAKKKRLMSGLSEMTDRLKTMGPTNESIPSIQIITQLISTYPDFPQTHEMKELLDYVVDVTHDCRQYEMMSHCFKLFRIVVVSLFERRQDSKELVQSSLQLDNVTKLWESIWKCIIAHQCHQETFFLLATLLYYRLASVPMARQLIQLLARPGGSVKCNHRSMLCLAAFLHRYTLPDQNSAQPSEKTEQNSSSLSWNSDPVGDRSIRSLLTEWLLNCQDKEIEVIAQLHFRLFAALAMKQPTIQSIDIGAQLSRLSVAIQFDLECQSLESKFCYIELLDQSNFQEREKSIVTKPLTIYPMSTTVLEEQYCLMTDRCLRMALSFGNYNKVTHELPVALDDAICLLSLVRNVVLSGQAPDTAQLREKATQLLNCIFRLVLSENTIYSRRCLQKFTTLFNTESASQTGQDFLRSAIWDLCRGTLERKSASGETSDSIFGEIRRGGASLPSVQPVDQTQEDKKTSLFDLSILTDREGWQVELYRLLATVSSPTDPTEAVKTDYCSMKKSLVQALSDTGIDLTCYLHLQLGFCVLRAYCRAPVKTLDANLVTDLVDLISGLGLQFIYDYEAGTAVLNLLPLIINHVSNVGSPYSKTKIISLFLRFQTGVQEEMFGPPVEEAFYRCLASLPSTAEWLTWGAGTLEQEGNKSLICLESLAGLSRPFNSTVVAASQAVPQLFEGDTYWQNSVLATMSSSIVTKDLGAQDQRDVAIRTSAVLQLFCSIIVKSSWAEKPAFVMMLRFARYHAIEADCLQRALEFAARQLNLDYHGWLDSRLEFLLDRWLDTEQLDHFPFGIYNCSSFLNFIEKYQNVVVPIVFLKSDIQNLVRLAALMAREVSDLLSQHLPSIMAKILSRLSEAKLKDHEAVGVTLNRFAQTKFQEIQQYVERNRISQILKENLLELLTRLILTVHDSGAAGLLFGPDVILPVTGSFRIEGSNVVDAVRHFSPDFIADPNVMPFENLILWIGSCPWEVHTLLVEIFVAYETGHRLTDKQQAMVHLLVASDLLASAIEEHQETMLYFVFYSLIHRMGHIIRQEETDETLRRGAMVIVKGLVVKVIRTCPETVAQLMLTIVGFVTPIAKTSGSLQWLAFDILDFLIIENRNLLTSATSLLSPFPSLPQFAHLSRALEENKRNKNRTLEEEINLFLSLVDQLGHDNIPVESVENLAKLLATRKSEVIKMYAQLESVDGSSSECGRPSLHRLVCSLIQLGNKKPSLSEAVATALGELGPADLATLILQPDTPVPDTATIQGQMENHALQHSTLQLAVAVFPHLVRYLFADENVHLLSLSGRVMLSAMGSVEGQQFSLLAKKYSWPSRPLLVPFRVKAKGEQKLMLDLTYFESNIDDSTLWTPSKAGHSPWLIRLTSTLINTFRAPNFFATLLPVCRLQPEFCYVLLPFVVRAMLTCGELRVREVISTHINAVLGRCKDWSGKTVDPSIKTLLQVVQHLRSHEREKKNDLSWDRNFRLALNYLDAARAAQSCSAYFSTIMFSELWLDRLNMIGHSESLYEVGDGGFRKMDQVQDLLLEAYTCTGELDGRTGFQSLPDIHRYEQDSDWFRALEFYDAQASYSDSDDRQTFTLSALSRCGLYRTLADVTTNQTNPAVREYQNECAWRLANWNLHQETDMVEEKPGFHQLLFNSLIAVKQGDQSELVQNLSECRSLVINQLRQAGSLESCRIIYPALTLLRLVRDVEDVSQSGNQLTSLQEKWVEDRLPVSDFSYSEPALALRAIMLKELLPRTPETTTALVDTLLETCRKARQHGNYPVAGRCLTQLSTLPDLSKDLQFKCRMEKALTEWQRKDGDRALNTLRSLAAVLERDSIPNPIYPRVLNLLGQWLHETRSENPRQILSLYFRKSLEAAQASQSRHKWSGSANKEIVSSCGVSDARQILAAYADSLYKDLQNYIESRDFETQQKLARIRQGRAAELKKMRATAPEENRDEVRRANLFMTNETTNDMSEFETLFKERESFLLEAVENYLIGIREEASGENQNSLFDVRISRLISLWFDNRTNVNLTELMVKWLPKLPSYHFIAVLPQLAARLVSKPNPQSYHDEFPKLIQNLLDKCALEHPYHTLPVILALAMTNKDREIEEGSRAANQQPEEDRVTAAKKLVQKISKRPEGGALCKKLEQLHLSLIRLANKEVNVKDRNLEAAMKIPTELSNMKNLEDVAIPTVQMAVNPDGVYRTDQVVGVVSFDPHFVLVGGINAPKKMACLGTDGKTRPMLLKGKDDLRQDAVMQQVFSTMNIFLEQDEQARRRKLNIRKYKVVPLSRRSGLLEWCEGTNPIGLYLTGKDGKSGAHQRYAKPGDLTTDDTRKEMFNLKDIKSSDERLRRFREICSRFPPVFRHFFLERYTAPSQWFEKRLSYTRSAAASSMVGYILGLGDRHLHNILIDEKTAELIHIDFGIAFDQGTVLPIPETVPFRLTRDIVDAMGVMGVEGVFRRCCEFTMEVMRKQQDSILTLLEVLLYDPLYVWTMTPQKAAALQQKQRGLSKRRGSTIPEQVPDDEPVDNEVNESAKRTLVRLSQKLRGVEKGTPLSVRGQINLLIQQAIDPANLYRIYHGWKPQA